MNKLFKLSGLFFLIYFSSFAQKVNKDFIAGEIYLKVREKPLGSISNTVNLNTELLFLQKFSSDLILPKSTKPFFSNSASNLQKLYRISVKDTSKTDSVLALLRKQSSVEYAERVPLRKIIATPNDPDAGSQWHLSKIKAFEAWSVNAGNANIVVAIVDNAIQTNHPDLQANMLSGWDLGDNDNNPNPIDVSFSHGTHVAGIVSAVSNNNLGVASASNNRIKILPVKATPDYGDPRSIYYGFEGILWAADHGAQIISLSWGGVGYSQAEQEVIDYAYNKGIVIVAAAGNEDSSTQSYPAAYNHVIAVASLDDDDKRSSFSNFGEWVDISAPGRNILSTYPFNTYASLNGTSMATPLVASTLGYIWSCFPSLSPSQLESLLMNTADNIDTANPSKKGLLGAGRINLLKAVSCPTFGIPEATITPSASTYICQGQSVALTANTDAGLTYEWIKNGLPIQVQTQTLNVNNEGNYQVIVNKGTCRIVSAITKVGYNTYITPLPEVLSKEVAYCTPLTTGEGLKATVAICNYSGPTTFSYYGPSIGYDGLAKTGDDPSVNVIGLEGTITAVKVSITWQKKDQGFLDACDMPDWGLSPYNDEVSFKLKSPKGTIITLVKNGTYGVGTTTSGIVTTTFVDGGSTIVQYSIPVSGTFAPADPLSTFNNETATGVWTLLPEDDNPLDPLCVSGFSVTISTNAASQPPVVSWWTSPTDGTQLATGTEYRPSTEIIGEKTFYVQALCNGFCPSARVPVRFSVVTVPQVFVFPISNTLSNNLDFKTLIQKQTVQLTKTTDNSYIIFDAANPKTTNIVVSNTPPLTSPITLCSKSESYLLLAVDCPTNVITWNNGLNGQSLIVTPDNPIGYNAYCHKEWSPCVPISSNNILFISPLDNVSISNKVYTNSIQKFTGTSISASNEIQTPAQTTYQAQKYIMLNAGFTVNANSVFTAQIKDGCGN